MRKLRKNIVWSLALSIAVGLSVVACSSHKDKLQSSGNGYTADAVPISGVEGGFNTIIKKSDKIIAEVKEVKPVSFSPDGDILLVREAMPDDDCRQYLLNIGAGEYRKKGNRFDYVFGGRYMKEAVWSEDGKTVTLVYEPNSAEISKETFIIENYIE